MQSPKILFGDKDLIEFIEMTNKEFIKKIALVVKDSGLKKGSKTLFDNSVPTIFKIVEPQKYSVKMDGYDVFTLNIGIFVPEIHQKLYNTLPMEVLAVHGIINMRIEELITIKKGKLEAKNWIIRDVNDTLIDLYETFKYHIIPFFENINSLENLDLFIDSHSYSSKTIGAIPFEIAVLKFILNKKDESRDCLVAIVEKNKNNKAFRDKAIEVSKLLFGRSVV